MVAFCNEIVDEIVNAKSEEELIRVISISMSRLRKEQNSFNEPGFVMNMIVTLRSISPKDLSDQTLSNVKLAVAIFRQFQKENPGPIA